MQAKAEGRQQPEGAGMESLLTQGRGCRTRALCNPSTGKATGSPSERETASCAARLAAGELKKDGRPARRHHAVDLMSQQEMCHEAVSERTFELPCTFPTVGLAITKTPDRLEPY